MIRSCLKIGVTVFLAIVAALIFTSIFEPVKVLGNSMAPCINEEEFLLVNKICYIDDKPKRGEIVVFNTQVFSWDYSREQESTFLIKRVVGIEGDIIRVTNGEFFRNDRKIARDCRDEQGNLQQLEEIRIRENCVFVLGDNVKNSRDSRDITIGQVEIGDIIGRAEYRILPLEEMGKIDEKEKTNSQ